MRTHLNDIKETDEHIITDHENDLDQFLVYENGRYRYDTNRTILLATTKFCIDKKGFALPLFYFVFSKLITVPLLKNFSFSFSF